MAALVLAACTSEIFVPGFRKPEYLVERHPGWQLDFVKGEHLWLRAAFSPSRDSRRPLTVYIEGDGRAWIRGQQSADPTPSDPIGLRLALAHPGSGPVAYLARPCQYLIRHGARCDPRLWSSHRYAETVVAAYDSALDAVKKRYDAPDLQLVGYSGGGPMAVLVAARRNDVARIVTVAGNLDIEAWVRAEDLTPLYGSLNAADFAGAVARIPQIHYVGADDKVVRPVVVQSYQRRLPGGSPSQVAVLEDVDHECCWVERWPDLARRAGLGD